MLRAFLFICIAYGLSAAPWTEARAECLYTGLASGLGVQADASPSWYSFNQNASYWTGVAVRSGPGADWNLAVHPTTDAEPACVSAPLGSSTRTTGVDLMLGNFNSGHNALGVHYVSVTRAGGAGNATLEWDGGSHALTVNGPLVSRTVDATDVIEVWDVYLQAGKTYGFIFDHEDAALSLLLFRGGSGPYWAGRGGAEFDVTAGTSYTAPTTGYYGVAVVHEDDLPGSYSLRVGTCTPPATLASTVAVSTAGLAERHYACDQTQVFWTGVAVRGASNWNLELYGSDSGSDYPTCLGNSLVRSDLSGPSVDVALRNYNYLLPLPFYVRAYMDGGAGTGAATVEWDSGADFIAVDGPSVTRTTSASDVLEVWDVYLTAGSTYLILFNTYGADLSLTLYPPHLSSARRSDAILDRSGNPNHVPYVAAFTGWHALAIVNESGGNGTYGIQIAQNVVGVGDAQALPTALKGVFPNPAPGPARVEFTLNTAALVSLDVLDVAGRVISRSPRMHRTPGRWSILLDEVRSSGGRLAPGIYFLRMKVDDRPVGLSKFVLLD